MNFLKRWFYWALNRILVDPIEVATNQDGQLLWVERYIFSRLNSSGSTIVRNWKHYEVISSSMTDKKVVFTVVREIGSVR
jgi:hypothetical protein